MSRKQVDAALAGLEREAGAGAVEVWACSGVGYEEWVCALVHSLLRQASDPCLRCSLLTG